MDANVTPVVDAVAELTPDACLARSPVDLSVAALEAAPPSFYVNELRLGYSRGGAVFSSRPLCDLYGKPLCRFVEAHEQAHHYTKTVGQKSACAETLADCWAAVHADTEAVKAALHFFRSRRGAGGYHGDPNARAATIARCSNGWEHPQRLVSEELDDARWYARQEGPIGTEPAAFLGRPPRPGRAFRVRGRARR